MIFLILILESVLAPFVGIGVILAYLLSPLRGRLSGLWKELPERFGRVSPEALTAIANRPVLWLHGASAGEINGLMPLVKALALRPQAPAIVITSTTRAGRDAARVSPDVTWAQLSPIDAWPCVAYFIRQLRPIRLILTETELWPTLLIIAQREKLFPTLINARLTKKSFSFYSPFALFLKPALGSLKLICAQSETDAQRFQALGVEPERMRVTGNSKYDQLPSPSAAENVRVRVYSLGWDRFPLLVAGSTHPAEEDMLCAAFLQARRAAPTLKLIVAPRHLERVSDCQLRLERGGLRACLWSAPDSPNSDALIIDSMGLLTSFYVLARAAFVGGTLVDIGGHNLLEPALARVPVLFGPHTDHIESAATLLLHDGGGRLVTDTPSLTAAIEEFASSDSHARKIGGLARTAANKLQGAAARTIAALDSNS